MLRKNKWFNNNANEIVVHLIRSYMTAIGIIQHIKTMIIKDIVCPSSKHVKIN